METININWSTYKSVVSPYLKSYYINSGTSAEVIASTGSYIFMTKVVGADYDDFVGNYQSNSVAVSCIDEALAFSMLKANQITLDIKTSDGKSVYAPNIFPGRVFVYYAGAGDSTSVRGDGTAFYATKSSSGDEIVEWNFIDWVYVAGGGLMWENAKVGDSISLELYAPATVVVPNASNTGNCDIINGVIVPAAGNGAYDVDLTVAVPVPAYNEEMPEQSGTGFWEVTDPTTGKGVITPGVPGQAKWHLIAANVALTRFVNKMPMLNSATIDLSVPAVKPKKALPQWKFKLTLHNNDGTATLNASWYLITARAKTV